MSRYRSAGACPPRAFGNPEHGEGQALALRERDPFFDEARLFRIVSRKLPTQRLAGNAQNHRCLRLISAHAFVSL